MTHHKPTLQIITPYEMYMYYQKDNNINIQCALISLMMQSVEYTRIYELVINFNRI